MPSSVVSEEDFPETKARFVLVDALQDHGINASDISKLKAGGYFTVSSVHSATRKKLQLIKGFSDTKVDKIKEALGKAQPGLTGFTTGAEVARERQAVFRVLTGSKSLDTALGGGVQSQSVTEVFGEYRCGKTQLAHTMAVMAQLPQSMGGNGGKVAYIDTEGTYRPERIVSIAAGKGVDGDAANENILYAKVANSEHQVELLSTLSEHFSSDDGSYRLLIVDSLVDKFRVDFFGRGELQERQSRLNGFMHRLAELANEFNIAVLVTNQVQSDPGASALFASADGRKAVGGHIVSHNSATRILLRKGRAEERVAKIVDSPDVPEREATYIITEGGIKDPEKL